MGRSGFSTGSSHIPDLSTGDRSRCLLGGLLLILLLGVGGGGSPVGWFWLALILLIALLPGSELAVGLVNHLLTLVLPPRVLPKLELKEGIPEDCATFVVMPSMLVRPRSAEVLCERLETHYLANPGRMSASLC